MELLPIIQTFLMTDKTRRVFFIIFACLAFAAAVYHLVAVFISFDKTPAWRHALFIGINIIAIYGLVKRPKWFLWFVVLLTLQQWYSHGSYAIGLWQNEHRIHWISIGVIVLLPLLCILLFIDQKAKRSYQASHEHS
jgi:hypothetical protein